MSQPLGVWRGVVGIDIANDATPLEFMTPADVYGEVQVLSYNPLKRSLSQPLLPPDDGRSDRANSGTVRSVAGRADGENLGLKLNAFQQGPWDRPGASRRWTPPLQAEYNSAGSGGPARGELTVKTSHSS